MTTTPRSESYQAGFGRGHTAANWQEAQTSLPVPNPVEEAARRAGEEGTYDREEWVAGFVEGWQLRMDGCYEDGSPMETDEE